MGCDLSGEPNKTPTAVAISVLKSLYEWQSHWGGFGFLGELIFTGAETVDEIEQAAEPFIYMDLPEDDIALGAVAALRNAIMAMRFDASGHRNEGWGCAIDATYAIARLERELYQIYTVNRADSYQTEENKEIRAQARHSEARAKKEEMIEKWNRIGMSEFDGNKTEFAKAQGLRFSLRTIKDDWLKPSNLKK